MDIPTQAELIARITAFCARHDIAETRFGRDAVNNPALLRQLRENKSPTLETLNKLSTYMERTDAAAATRAKLDKLTALTAPEEVEHELPFVQAPVNPTGASSPTLSTTPERPQSRKASGSCPASSIVAGPAGRATATPPTPSCSDSALVAAPSHQPSAAVAAPSSEPSAAAPSGAG